MKNEFDKNRQGTGTKEWSEHSFNVVKGCKNECVYCYARFNAIKRYGYVKDVDEWRNEVPNFGKAKKGLGKVDGVVMFPTVHDIRKSNYEVCRTAINSILGAGNDILIVTKPDPDVINHLMRDFLKYKEHIQFRFSISTMDENVMKIMEPGASNFADRMLALESARREGFSTSVSCEPCLEYTIGGIVKLVCEVGSFVTDTVWLGKLNRPERVMIGEQPVREILSKVLDFQDQDENILKVYDTLKDNPWLRWKDSYKQVLRRNGIKV